MFMTATSSETRAEAEADILGLVPRVLNQRESVVYTDWTEWRYPLHAKAGRHAHRIAGEDCIAELRRTAEAPKGADIDERLAEDPDLLGQAQRKADFGSAGVEIGAAQRVGGDRIARPDAADREAAQVVTADEEQVVQPQRRAAVGDHRADRATDRGDDILEDAPVVDVVGRGTEILLRAEGAGHGQRVADQQALCRIEAGIAGIPSDRLGNFRNHRRAGVQLHDLRGKGLHVVDIGLAQGVADGLPRVLGVGPAGAQCEADAGIAIGGDRLTVIRRAEDVEAHRHGTVQEIGLGEAEVDQGAQGTDREAEAELLALAQEVAFVDRDIAQNTRRRRKAGAKGDVAGALLDHLDFEVGLVGRRPRGCRNVDLLEEAEGAQALLAAAHFGGAESVTLGEAEFPPDHLVEGAGVARDVDAFDIDARTLLDVEGHVDREIVLVAPDVGADVDEGVAQGAYEVRQCRNGFFDRAGVVPVAFGHREIALQDVDIESLEARGDLDLAELVSFALVDGEGDEKSLPVGRQLGDRRHDAEIGVALREVELAQQLAIEVEAVGVVAVVRRQEAVPGAFARADLAAQRAVAEMLVADEADALNARDVAFADLEDEVYTTLVELDDLGVDRRVVAAAAAIDGQDTFDVGLHARARENLARLRLHFVAQLVVFDLAVTLEGDAVDDRVLGDFHDQGRPLHVDHDICKKSGPEQRLQRAVGRRRVVGLAFLELEIGANRLGFGADVALNLNGSDCSARRCNSAGSAALGMGRRTECENRGNGQNGPTKDQTHPRHLPDLPASFRSPIP